MARFHNMNAEYFEIDGVTYFKSYDTMVCVIDTNMVDNNGKRYTKVTLLQNWDYSATTCRQVMRFINETFPWLCLSARELKRDIRGTDCMWYGNVQVVYDPQPMGKLNAYHVPGTPLSICI